MFMQKLRRSKKISFMSLAILHKNKTSSLNKIVNGS